jgi:hypothetical protein
MGQADRAVAANPGIVGAAVGQDGIHPFQQAPLHNVGRIEVDLAANAAHVSTLEMSWGRLG